VKAPTLFPVYLEIGAKRVFACAADWPGWCRSGKDERQALEALVAAAPRYAPVATAAGFAFPATISVDALAVVERLQGSTTTDFGAPAAVAMSDLRPLAPGEAEGLAALLMASWATFGRVVAGAPAKLRKGPRGGGRDRDPIVHHVLAAEAQYARKLGIRRPQPDLGDTTAIDALRAAIVGTIRSGELPALPSRPTSPSWPLRYAARRIAWHVLDHAWEIEDRTDLGGLVDVEPRPPARGHAAPEVSGQPPTLPAPG